MQASLATDTITTPHSLPLPMRQVQRNGLGYVEGEASMTKEEALAAIKLLSALESWAFSQQSRLPDYLVDDIQRSMSVLERVILEKP
jgi:hypothetical protein